MGGMLWKDLWKMTLDFNFIVNVETTTMHGSRMMTHLDLGIATFQNEPVPVLKFTCCLAGCVVRSSTQNCVLEVLGLLHAQITQKIWQIPRLQTDDLRRRECCCKQKQLSWQDCWSGTHMWTQQRPQTVGFPASAFCKAVSWGQGWLVPAPDFWM